MARAWWGTLLCVVALGCGGDDDDAAKASPICESGRVVSCACPDGSTGAQACKTDGSGYEACECGSAGSSGSSGASGSSGSAGAGGTAGSGGTGGTAGSAGTGATAGSAGWPSSLSCTGGPAPTDVVGTCQPIPASICDTTCSDQVWAFECLTDDTHAERDVPGMDCAIIFDASTPTRHYACCRNLHCDSLSRETCTSQGVTGTLSYCLEGSSPVGLNCPAMGNAPTGLDAFCCE